MIASQQSSNSNVSADLKALMKIDNLELRARSIVEGHSTGLHRSPRHGFSAEFAEYRSYVPGDDIRYLDWKVLARRDKCLIKKFREETNLQSQILLDLSRSMNYGSQGYSKLEYARTLAATLSMFLYQQGEEVGLLLYDQDPIDYLPPRHRSGHLHSILSALSRPADGHGAALNSTIDTILSRSRMRGLVFVISDYLTPLEDLKAPLTNLAASGHDITLLQVLDPTEIHFTFDESMNFEDLESGIILPTDPNSVRTSYLNNFNKHQEGIKSLCDELGILHHLLSTDEPLENSIHQYLSDRSALGQRIERTRSH